MANTLYDKGRQGFLEGAIAWLTDTIASQLVDMAAYTPDLVNNQFLSDIPSGARIGSPVTLSSKSSVGGVADAADVSHAGLIGAPSLEAIVIFQSTGNPSTSRLIALIDTATGLPVTAGATQVDIAWSNGVNKIFKL
jgi:hypothetical protein